MNIRRPGLPLALIALLAVLSALPSTQLSARERKPVSTASHAHPYSGRSDVAQFISDMVERHGFSRDELQVLFRKANHQPSVIKAITPPTEVQARSWQNYRATFVNASRIEAGQQFRVRHAAALARAVEEFGVPEEIIVAIIGVETVYGRNMGNYRVIDALVTLAFDYPRRADYFRTELENYLLFTREAGMDAFSIKGSYAGAIGIPQFMPGSYRRFAVDYDGSGKINLISSPVDAIGSVANFLKAHGWERGAGVAYPATAEGDAWRKITEAGIKPAHRLGDLPAFGVTAVDLPNGLAPDTLCTLVELETPGQAMEFHIGLGNFFTLTRYNRSSFYAMAVLDLARALKDGANP